MTLTSPPVPWAKNGSSEPSPEPTFGSPATRNQPITASTNPTSTSCSPALALDPIRLTTVNAAMRPTASGLAGTSKAMLR